MFKVFFKVLLALASVFAFAALLQYFGEQRSDYIKIYGDDDESYEGYY